jgi:CRP-like cAMP-binding protein
MKSRSGGRGANAAVQVRGSHSGKEVKTQIRPESLSRQGRRRPHRLHLSQGQAVFSQGDLADSIFYIQQGRVKITVISEHGKEAVVASSKAKTSSARAA